MISMNKEVDVLGKLNIYNTNVKIGKKVKLYDNITFLGDGDILIKDRVKLGNNVVIYASKRGGIVINENSIIAANTYIIDSNHGIQKDKLIQSQELSSCKIIIGEDVWIGANCTIAKGSIIKNGAIIGANSFVNKVCEENFIYAGIPVKKIKERN